MNNEEYIRNLVDDPSVDLMGMYDEIQNNCSEMLESVYTWESLIEIMIDHARDGHGFGRLAMDLDENQFVNLFLFDWSMPDEGCVPIENKEELASACIENCV